MTARRCWCFMSAALIAMAGVKGAATIPPALSAADLHDAIRLGETGAPEPYLLHHLSTSERQNPVLVGAVYTPFIRVALAARTAQLAGQRFEIEDVTRELASPVVYVALRWYCCDSVHGDDPSNWNPLQPPTDYQIADDRDPLLAQSIGRGRLPHAPLRIERGSSLLQPFGPLPFDDIVLVAVYPLTEFATPAHFVIFQPGIFVDGSERAPSVLTHWERDAPGPGHLALARATRVLN